MDKKQSLLGVAIVAAGLLFLLANLDVGAARTLVEDWWPLAVVATGGFMLWADRQNYVWSFAVMALGFLLLVNTLGIADVSMGDVFWPLVLIVGGISLLVSARHRQVPLTSNRSEGDITALLGGVTAVNASDDYTGGKVTAILGGVELDLSKATIKKEAVLHVSVFMGGLELRVPEGVNVKMRATGMLGGVEDKSYPKLAKNAPVLYLDGSITMGGVEIKR